MIRASKAVVVIFFLIGSGCPPERPSRSPKAQVRTGVGDAPVVKVGSESISLREYQQRIDGLPEYVRPRLATVESRAQHLDSVVDFELLADEAERRGYGEEPRVVDATKEALARRAASPDEREKVIEKMRKNSDVKIDADAVKRALELEKK